MGGVGREVALGIGFLVFDTAMTFLVVNRVVERQDEKKRRNLSGLAESRTLEALDGLLADGLPRSARDIDVRLLTVGRAELPLRVSEVKRTGLEESWRTAPQQTAGTIGVALERYAPALTHPLNVAIIEPKLAPSLVHLINCIDSVAAANSEVQAQPSEEAFHELEVLMGDMLDAALHLRGEIGARWA